MHGNLYSFFTPPASSESSDDRKEDSNPSTDEEPEVETEEQLVDNNLKRKKHTSEDDEIPSDLATTKNHSPCQPKLTQFPSHIIAGKQRSFSSSWYSYSWLEYSVQQDACFCFPCRMFYVEERNSKDKFHH